MAAFRLTMCAQRPLPSRNASSATYGSHLTASACSQGLTMSPLKSLRLGTMLLNMAGRTQQQDRRLSDELALQPDTGHHRGARPGGDVCAVMIDPEKIPLKPVKGKPRPCDTCGKPVTQYRWSPYWCPKHDIERMERIDKTFAKIATALGR